MNANSEMYMLPAWFLYDVYRSKNRCFRVFWIPFR